MNQASTNSAVARTTRRKGSEIRSLILESARDLFATHGYRKTTSREIAAAAGVSERLIYFHFVSKPNLFEQAVVAPFTAFMEAFIEDWRGYADTPHDLEYVARRWIGGMYNLLRQHRRLVLALLTADAYEGEVAGSLSGKESPIAAIHSLTEQIMSAEFEKRGYEGVDLRLTVRLPFATLLATAVFDGPVFAGIGRRPSRDTIVEEMTSLIVYGATGRTQTTPVAPIQS
ncbi:TetR/AcrR family transcriptional regulator [Mycobacterium sp.]|uniref:TetR/AcrR family transcriptional regulator n=1 Tax=Mycobacterium sp. TaxID=1785 RepID=UPI003BB040A1